MQSRTEHHLESFLILPHNRDRGTRQGGIKIHRAHSIPRIPPGYLPCHMGNSGLHSLDMEMHTFSPLCYTQIKNINAGI